MNRPLLFAFALAGCPAKHVPDRIATPPEGTSIAVYLGREPGSTIAMIDDRRTLAIANHTLTLDRVDPSSQPLVIEALDHPLSLGACTRERRAGSPLDELAQPRPPSKQAQTRPSLPVPTNALAPHLRCRVSVAAGTYLVRVLQATPLPSFKTYHQVTYAGGDRAKVQTRFAFTTLPWGKQAAALSVFEGLPAAEQPPTPIARSTVTLDGATTTLQIPAVETTARLRVVFDGAIRDPSMPVSDIAWGRDSRAIVMSVLELDNTDLTVGQIDVHFEGVQLRDTTVLPRDRDRAGTAQRLGLEPVTTLRGSRRAFNEFRDGAKTIRSKIAISVTNMSNVEQKLSIEEPLRPKLKRVVTGLPATAKVIGDQIRADVVLQPQATEMLDFTVTYTL